MSLFQSTLLMRGATRATRATKAGTQDFNPRSSCEERPRYMMIWTKAL